MFVFYEVVEKLRESFFEVGVGVIGNYDNCSFNIKGLGSFNGNEDVNFIKGKKGEIYFEEEI